MSHEGGYREVERRHHDSQQGDGIIQAGLDELLNSARPGIVALLGEPSDERLWHGYEASLSVGEGRAAHHAEHGEHDLYDQERRPTSLGGCTGRPCGREGRAGTGGCHHKHG